MRNESNGKAHFIIRDLEKFQVYNLYYSHLLFYHFSKKIQIYLSFTLIFLLKAKYFSYNVVNYLH